MSLNPNDTFNGDWFRLDIQYSIDPSDVPKTATVHQETLFLMLPNPLKPTQAQWEVLPPATFLRYGILRLLLVPVDGTWSGCSANLL